MGAEPLTVLGERVPDDVGVAYARYGDLDLTSERDQRRLHARIKMAVRQVCSDRIIMALSERLELPECRIDAFEQGEKQMQQAIARASKGQQVASASVISIAVR